ncbi:hypothetical protein H7J87_22790 [Mycolicibacterium wolinskyi]|uniref:Uncharacterized protein n=1 Tax=Mycolicibacterium wolinskyi TaxID=59750 RepID=A0A1X2FIY7_9MYCO|nr:MULTISPECIES: hypothetical protein [Mycolicibacterium]MCV7288153.1 hypothetical protein [Mycolicibacterium wolinskyi]MCV7296878.1 hypothetical protein [Mycolicibacterium goodii]ORX18394.1 hypothetical protein AWC31_13880 [Mycolicibacterium wolinskyi]
MTSTATHDDPVRAQILAAMDRLLAGQPLRSTGRLSVSQLAVEADIPRWHLTHQHVDLKELFQAKVRNADGAPAAFSRHLSDYAKLKADHAKLIAHCAELEQRLQLYATVINVLALERDTAHNQRPVTNIRTRRRIGSPDPKPGPRRNHDDTT